MHGEFGELILLAFILIDLGGDLGLIVRGRSQCGHLTRDFVK